MTDCLNRHLSVNVPGVIARAFLAMTLTAELYFSFRSPYSYLAIGRYRRMAEAHDLDIAFRTVFPLAIRDPGFFRRADPKLPKYVRRDAARVHNGGFQIVCRPAGNGLGNLHAVRFGAQHRQHFLTTLRPRPDVPPGKTSRNGHFGSG